MVVWLELRLYVSSSVGLDFDQEIEILNVMNPYKNLHVELEQETGNIWTFSGDSIIFSLR